MGLCYITYALEYKWFIKYYNSRWSLGNISVYIRYKNVLITGGNYGMDTSLLSICSYIAVIIVIISAKKTF